MEDILKELHSESLIPHFLAERIEPTNVAALSDEELCRVGVTTIGDRLRLRDLCAVAEKDRTDFQLTIIPFITTSYLLQNALLVVF